MKKKKTFFWIITAVFSALMLLSAIPNILVVPDSVEFMNGLGYPNYIIPFLGVAKLSGIIAILIPGYQRIKEWAYAGLFFDLAGAIYSLIAHDGFQPQVLIILLIVGLLFSSYILYHKMITNNS